MDEKPWIVVRLGRLPVALRVSRRVPVRIGVVLLLLLVVMWISSGYGEFQVPAVEVLRAVLGIETAEPQHTLVVRSFRLPRIVLGVMVGAALAVSGGILQGVTRNSLAGPGILGINAGAGLAAVALLTLSETSPASLLPWAACAGALATAAVIYLLSWRGGTHSLRLILTGIGLAAFAAAATNYLILLSDVYRAQQALIWLTGSLYGRDWDHVRLLAVWLVVFLPLAFLLAHQLNVLTLGDDIARGLGQRVELKKGLLLLVSVVLAAASVAVAGSVGFVGFIAPHIARNLVGSGHEGLLPTAAAIGALLMVVSDLVARAVVAPAELPVGVVTGILGAPYFLYLLSRQKGG